MSPAQNPPDKPATGSQSLVTRTTLALRELISGGRYKPGDRLPTEAQMTKEYGVSRTVVREAVAALRADGLVEPRQGAGVFVTEPPPPAPFSDESLDLSNLAPVMELLELRTAVEVEAAGLAAQRCSPAQQERILSALDAVVKVGGAPASWEADLNLHLAIAEATNNPRFAEFLRMLRTGAIPRRSLGKEAIMPLPPDYVEMINAEHRRIVDAVLDGDTDEARAAMRHHLQGSLKRYRGLVPATA